MHFINHHTIWKKISTCTFKTLCIIFPDNIWYTCDSKDPSRYNSSLDFWKVDSMLHLSSLFSLIHVFHDFNWAPTMVQGPTHLHFPLGPMFQAHEGSSPSMSYLSGFQSLLTLFLSPGGPFLYSSPKSAYNHHSGLYGNITISGKFCLDDRTCHWYGGREEGCKATRGSITYSFPMPWS